MKRAEGRYVVGDKAVPSLGAAVAYALHEAMQQKPGTTLYVREVGREGALYRVERTTTGAQLHRP